MARVFLSYDRDDSPLAGLLANALEQHGYSVWWDRRIEGGAQFSKQIETALSDAEAVIVIWSAHSIESPWVRDEASEGRDQGKLIPVSLDGTKPPLGFRQFQTIDLAGWKGNGRSRQLRPLLAAVDALAPASAEEPAAAAGAQADGRLGFRSKPLLLIGVIALCLVVGAALLWRPWKASGAVPLVAVQAADQSQDSTALARAMLVRLGDFQAAHPDALKLTDKAGGERPNLILEVSGSTAGKRVSANLLLLRGTDRMLLSSQEIAGQDERADMLQASVGASAARLLGCAAEAMPPRARLADDLLKLYLGACGRFDGLYGVDDISLIIPQLEQVTSRAPEFEPGWKHLLLAAAASYSVPTDQQRPSAAWVRSQIDAARRLHEAPVEARVAELQLLPATAYQSRISRAQQLARDAPDDANVLDVAAEQLMSAGAMSKALEYSEKASLLAPESPAAQAAHIKVLAFSGRIDSAFQKLKEAEPLMVGSKNLLEARFRINMRYGDPQDALDLLHRYGTSKQHDAFLKARLNPTPANVAQAIAISRSVSDGLQLFGAHSEVLAQFGRIDELRDLLMQLPIAAVEPGLLATLFKPNLKPLRADGRFLLIAKRFQLLDYWRSSGNWPDFCSEPDLPYDCKSEAAKSL